MSSQPLRQIDLNSSTNFLGSLPQTQLTSLTPLLPPPLPQYPNHSHNSNALYQSTPNYQMGTNKTPFVSNFSFTSSESPIRPTNYGHRTFNYTQENIVFENLPSTNCGIFDEIPTTENINPLKRPLLPEPQDENASKANAAKGLWSGKVRPELESYVREILDEYAVNDGLSFQQRINLFHGIITYLFMYTEPVPMMTKTVQSVTVHSVMQLVINAKQSENGAGEIEVEPFFGKVFSHPKLSFFVLSFFCFFFQFSGKNLDQVKLFC